MQKFLVLMVFCHSQVFVNGDFHKSVMSSACTKVLFLPTEVQRLRITAEHIESLLQQFMHYTFSPVQCILENLDLSVPARIIVQTLGSNGLISDGVHTVYRTSDRTGNL